MAKLKSALLFEQMQAKWDEIKAIRDKVVAESREFTQDEKTTIQKGLDEVRDLEVKRNEAIKDESLSGEIQKLEKLFSGGQPPASGGGNGQQAKGSLGRQFVSSQEWQGFLKQFAPSGHLANLRGFTSPPVEVKNLLDGYGRKELIIGMSDVSAGAFIIPDQSGIYEPIGRFMLSLRQLIDVRQTGSDIVEWVAQTRQVTQATPTAEANVTEYSGATGEVSGEKPEGISRWERYSTPVKTIPVWIPATNRVLADAPQLRSLIDSDLRADVNEELENQLLNGNGVGENFTGLANTAGVLIQVFNTDIAVTARMAITNLLINGRQVPTSWLLHPVDWQNFDLLRDANNQFYWGGPARQGTPTLWGVPVAQSFFLGQGAGWLANWRKMVLWDREQATIAISDSHADFFIRNMVAIRCELRAAMGIIRPTAFVETEWESGS